MVLSGDLSFEEDNVEVVYTVPDEDQVDPATHSRALHITGTIWDAHRNSVPISVYVLHAIHTFHDEAWDLFTFVGGGYDRYGDLNQLISGTRKKPGGDFQSIHCTRLYAPQLCQEMSN